MKSLIQKFGWPPRLGHVVWGVIVIAVVLSATVGVTSGPLAGITLLVGFSGVVSLIFLFVPARPKVDATLRGTENATSGSGEIDLLIGADRAVRPLDIDRIIEDEERDALETMPRAPTPMVPKGAFGGVFDLNRSASDLLASTTGVTDEELRAFIKEVRDFGRELRNWLEDLETARSESLRPFAASARVSEKGQAPADFTWLYLRFPQGFEEAASPPEVPEPPERPKFVSRWGRSTMPLISQMKVKGFRKGALRDLLIQRDREPSAARYSSEDGTTVISFQVGHINQHVHRDTGPFELRAPEAGIYEVGWQVSADGLSPPAEGSFKIEIREPRTGSPITTLSEALAERESQSLD